VGRAPGVEPSIIYANPCKQPGHLAAARARSFSSAARTLSLFAEPVQAAPSTAPTAAALSAERGARCAERGHHGGSGVGFTVFDSAEELEKIQAHMPGARLLLRILPDDSRSVPARAAAPPVLCVRAARGWRLGRPRGRGCTVPGPPRACIIRCAGCGGVHARGCCGLRGRGLHARGCCGLRGRGLHAHGRAAVLSRSLSSSRTTPLRAVVCPLERPMWQGTEGHGNSKLTCRGTEGRGFAQVCQFGMKFGAEVRPSGMRVTAQRTAGRRSSLRSHSTASCVGACHRIHTRSR
jgi:hypothetical protein